MPLGNDPNAQGKETVFVLLAGVAVSPLGCA
jgi:hypothetical protein